MKTPIQGSTHMRDMSALEKQLTGQINYLLRGVEIDIASSVLTNLLILALQSYGVSRETFARVVLNAWDTHAAAKKSTIIIPGIPT